ncbi:MAG: AAA family ATPase [candidate division Zixibacteria bacterium]|nr:AAA family ATPase [candidate division Zixibacteria bacterium]
MPFDRRGLLERVKKNSHGTKTGKDNRGISALIFASYIAVEGVIGAGKTTLAGALAKRFQLQLITEEVEHNPFLADFYADPARYAFQVQMFFLVSRFNQLQKLSFIDLFSTGTVCDYMFEKDGIFARMNLDDREYSLYQKIAPQLGSDLVKPELVIYLAAENKVLMERIKRRGRHFERNIDPDYIARLNEEYNRFFLHYDASPLLVVDANFFNFVDNPKHFQHLVEHIEEPFVGRKYLLPEKIGK